ncbi:unnamed protein product [Oppiella nova]|uniref:phosphatidylserine decarboxylase n=1 Tax=Oppiella nova TaxID=334625 RepID=A0A7R9LX98_9ACAR|nr:unnamed protein product [Oppiella nova]CAG2167544.1 unnamed protein product [Oppiella nova]
MHLVINTLFLFMSIFPNIITDYPMNKSYNRGEQSSIWTDTSNQVSLLSHHSTSFLDFKSDDNSDTKHITKDSYWRILAKKRGTFATNPLNKEALSYCHSLYLTSVIVVSDNRELAIFVLVSPADGTVLHFGRITNGRVEQVKGITYSLSKFLGPQNTYQTPTPTLYEYQQNLLQHNTGANQTALYSCVIYLSPGDYHRFHSPAQWSVDFRRHFAGHLLSVNPGVVQVFPQLFTINERVVYSGNWRYGYFSMAAVGATAVGTVRVYFDEV